jgi:hypothetical protein
VLIVAGAATMLLAAQALAADPLAAAQPGFTILDPLSASMLGLFLFGEHIQAGVADLAGEAAALALVIAGVSALSHSHLIVGERGTPPGPQPDTRRTPTANGPADDRSAGRVGGSSSGVLVLRGRATRRRWRGDRRHRDAGSRTGSPADGRPPRSFRGGDAGRHRHGQVQ